MTQHAAPVFTVGPRTVAWADVIIDARERGAWAEVAQETAALAGEEELGDAEANSRAAEFRYARGLVAGEEMEAWLARWDLTVRDWRRYIRRDVTPEDEWIVAVCSGAMARFATDLAGRLAVWDRMGGDDPDTAMTEFRAAAITEEALATLVSTRALDWTRIDAEVLSFAHDDAAQEALLCVSHDGLALGEIATLAGVRAERRTMRLAEFDDAERAALLGARAGDVVPLGSTLLRIVERRPPTLEDPDVRHRAEQAVVSRAIQRKIDDRVSWHVDL